MRLAVLTALAIVSLAGGCRQSESASDASVSGETNITSAATHSGAAVQPVSSEDARRLFHERHEGMEQIGKSTKTINRALQSGSPDLEAIRSSASTIAELARKSEGWFPAGTGHDVLPKTRALPAIWEKPDDFAAKDRQFREAAQALKSAADSGDITAIRSGFDTLGKTCKACHDSYRAEEHSK